ncbi:MAG: hypothetical protein M1484_03130 [Patescibacteria group bacterium]|nr:hypothetical protein [Patescibacteria group bacterium]MCL5432056.1 hypothetical protein [Patescibacteria group bacterium]
MDIDSQQNRVEIVSPAPTPTGPAAKPKRNLIPLLVAFLAVGTLLIVIVGVSAGITMIERAMQQAALQPSQTVAPAPVVNVTPVSSKYATDSGVLQLRDQLQTISDAIDAVDLIEPQIAPPALDLNLNIKTN